VDLVDELGLAENTLVIFTSDNGPTHLGPGQVDYEFFESAGGLRGLKGSVYEGGIRVPMIARWPGKIAPGTTSDHVSAFQDVLPTLAELGGAEVPDGVDGVSFLPTLLGESARQGQHEYLYWDFPGYGGQLAVRQGNWKAVRRRIRKDADAPIELYDLSVDPAESTDVASEHPEVAARMAKILHEGRTPPTYERLRFGTYAGE
jgi:arylsulfatase A